MVIAYQNFAEIHSIVPSGEMAHRTYVRYSLPNAVGLVKVGEFNFDCHPPTLAVVPEAWPLALRMRSVPWKSIFVAPLRCL